MLFKFKNIKALLIDLDGTVCFKNEQIQGEAHTIEYLRNARMKLKFLTNTDSKSPKFILDKVNSYGLSINLEEIHTPVPAWQLTKYI